MDRLEAAAREGYDRLIGLELPDVAVDGCLTKAPCGGEVSGPNPTDRGKLGIKRSTLVDAGGLPLGVVSAPANRHDSPLLAPTLDLLKDLGPLPESTCVHLDAGYDSSVTRMLLAERGLQGAIAHKGVPAPIQATKRWPVERTHARPNNFFKLARCTERRQIVADFYIALANTVVLVRRLLRRARSFTAGTPDPAAGSDLLAHSLSLSPGKLFEPRARAHNGASQGRCGCGQLYRPG